MSEDDERKNAGLGGGDERTPKTWDTTVRASLGHEVEGVGRVSRWVVQPIRSPHGTMLDTQK